MPRYHQLDALRGIASLQVLFGHMLIILPTVFFAGNNFVEGLKLANNTGWFDKLIFYLTYSPLHFFWHGSAAVNFFFLLSGFVLSSSLSGKKGIISYIQYLLKRFFRLYVPFVIIILISMVCRLIFYKSGNVDIFSGWMKAIWEHKVSAQEFFNLIVFRNRNFHNVVTTLWSIEVEIKMSVIVPLLIWVIHLFRRWKLLSVAWHIIIWCIAFLITHRAGKDFTEVPVFDEFVMLYILPFVTGILLFVHSGFFIGIFEKMKKIPVWCLLILAVILYTNRYISWKVWGIAFFSPLLFLENDVLSIAGALFVLLSFNPMICRFLSHKFLIYTGKISYSLYLVHPVVLAAIMYSLGAKLPYWMLAILILGISLPTAGIFYRLVEDPLNSFGRHLAGRIHKK